MKVEINKNRWLNRQSVLMQTLVLFMIFFISCIIGQVVADLLFGDPLFFKGTTKQVSSYLIKYAIFAFLWAFGFIYLINRKRKSTTYNFPGKE
jgi:hypothetical protein